MSQPIGEEERAMTGYVSIFRDPDEIEIRFRVEIGKRDVIGDARKILRPGERFCEWTFEDLLARVPGEVEFGAPPKGKAES
jgi:hypothetical protein